MNTKQILVVWLLMLLAGGVYAQTPPPELTWIKNPHKEMTGRYEGSPIVFKDKLYMRYNYRYKYRSNNKYYYTTRATLVTFDGKNWTSSIYKDEYGDFLGTRYAYTGRAIVYKDRLFMVFKDHKNDKYELRYTDGKRTKVLKFPEKYIKEMFVAANTLYIRGWSYAGISDELYAYDGNTFKKLFFYPKAAEYSSTVYYKGKIRIVTKNRIYTYVNGRFSDISFKGMTRLTPVIRNGELLCVAERKINTPCKNKNGKMRTMGYRFVAFDGKKVSGVYYLAKNHYSTDYGSHAYAVIDNNLYAVQRNCATDNYSFTVNRGKTRAKAYAFAATCGGNFIKYQNSIFVRYSNAKTAALTRWTFDSNNKLKYKMIENHYLGKAGPASIEYTGSPVVFKNELYLQYKGNRKGVSEYYLMKYIPSR